MRMDENGIHDVPVLDFVPIVRCKDCKWHEWYIRSRFVDGREYESDECRKFNMAVTPDWFCADGERRDERWQD